MFDIDLKARALQELGHDVTMVTTYSHRNDMPTTVPYPVISEQVTSPGQLGISYQVYRLLKKYESQADVFHIDGHIFLYAGGMYRRLGGKVPVAAFFNRELVVFPRDVPAYVGGKADEALPSMPRRVKESVRRMLEKSIGMWLANALDVTTFTSPVIQKVYRDFGLNTYHQLITPDLAGGVLSPKKRVVSVRDFVHILCAGRLIPTKGFDLALRALAKMQSTVDVHMTIVGGGPDEVRLKTLARELGVEDRVTFTGWLTHDALFPLFENADMFLMPRWRKELTSVVLMEAMSYGVPSVIPGGGGVEWQAGGGAKTFLYDNPESRAGVLDAVTQDAVLRQKLSDAALSRLDELHYRHWIPSLSQVLCTITGMKS